jgi:cell division ATPase FtsA
MFSLFTSQKQERFGVVIDIGSGSATVSLIASTYGSKYPKILWSKHEYAPLRQIDSVEESSKSVLTVLVNILLEFETAGRQALRKYKSGARITELQCGVAAPWSYTVSKTISYTQDEPFLVNREMFEELVQTAEKKIADELKENETMNNLGLVVASEATINAYANGYLIKNPVGKTVSDLVLVHTSVVVQTYLLQAIQDLQAKMFPGTKISVFSDILILHCIGKEVAPHSANMCLLDVTAEATEMGVVRGGVLTYATHTPFGLYSFAREVASIANIPIHEAFKHLHAEPNLFFKSLSKEKQSAIDSVFEAYIGKLEELFKETGDSLAIPRNIVIHADAGVAPLMTELLDAAVKRATKSEPIITLATNTIFAGLTADERSILPDTTMLVSARFFHKPENCLTLKSR